MRNIILRTIIPGRTRGLRCAGLSTVLGLTLLLLPGCSNNGNAATNGADIVGVYNLVSVDGKSLPCDLAHGGTAMTIRSGGFTINADGTCRSLTTFSVPGRGDASREAKATYSRKGDTLTMKWDRAGMTKGQVSGDSFTMVNEGIKFEYRK